MRLTLRVQLVLSSALLVLLAVAAVGAILTGQIRDTLRDQLRQRGVTIASHLAGVSADFLLASDKLALANIMSASLKNEDVTYAQLIDDRGIVRAAAPQAGIEGLYYPPAGLDNMKGSKLLVQRYYNGRQWIQDVAVAILVEQRVAGYVHVGMDETAILAEMGEARDKAALVALGVLLVASFLALILALAIARPLERLSTAVKNLGMGALDTRVRVGGPAELQRLEERFNAMAAKVESLVHGVIQSLATALSEHDQVSPGHAERVARYATRTARWLKCSVELIEEIRLASQLIDIGHMGVPSGLLHKSDPLSDEELRRLRTHPQVGARIIEPISVLKPVIPLLMHHHERWDGRGYPLGLKGEAIPMGARILAVCDAFDAMLTEKRHRRARSQDDAARELKRCAGLQFDPRVVDAFIHQLSSSPV